MKKLENAAKVIHPFSTVFIDFIEFKESGEVTKQEERYELGYPSDIVPYGEISEGFDCAIRKMHPDEEATLSLKSKLDPSNRHIYQVFTKTYHRLIKDLSSHLCLRCYFPTNDIFWLNKIF